METPSNVREVLKRLGKKRIDVADYCINSATRALEENGYHDAKLWATSVLSSILGDLEFVEDPNDLQEWADELDGIERDVIESVYETFEYVSDEITDVGVLDIRDTLVHELSKKLDVMDREKYRRLYG
jgi:hypothetical protein